MGSLASSSILESAGVRLGMTTGWNYLAICDWVWIQVEGLFGPATLSWLTRGFGSA